MLAHTPQPVVRSHVVAPIAHMRARGARLPSADVATRTFLGGGFGIALAQDDGATYPVQSTDGGRQWRVNGPALFTDTADAPLAIAQLTALSRRVQFTTGDGGGNVVDVTSDGGRVWRRAVFAGAPVAVVTGPGGSLLAYVQTGANIRHVTTLQYVSRDGGASWRYSTVLGGGR